MRASFFLRRSVEGPFLFSFSVSLHQSVHILCNLLVGDLGVDLRAAIDECPLIICKEMLPIKGNHIAVGNTRITGEEKEVASSLQLHLIRLKARLYNLFNEALSNARGRLFCPRSIVPLQEGDLALHTTL